MGRGRAKAKQTKVARELKYSGPATDFDRLQAELASNQPHHDINDELESELAHDDVALDDPYAKYYEDDEDEDGA